MQKWTGQFSAIICTIMILGMFHPTNGVAAQIYKTTDAQGNVVFTDDGSNGGEAVTINIDSDTKMTNTLPKKNNQFIKKDKSKDKKNKEKQEPFTISIASPKDNVTFAHSTTSIMVSASINKPLGDQDLIYLYVDGTQFGEGQKSQTFELKDTPRGMHTLKMSIEKEVPSRNKNIKYDREILATSPEIRFMQYRAFSSNQRN